MVMQLRQAFFSRAYMQSLHSSEVSVMAISARLADCATRCDMQMRTFDTVRINSNRCYKRREQYFWWLCMRAEHTENSGSPHAWLPLTAVDDGGTREKILRRSLMEQFVGSFLFSISNKRQ